MGYAKNPQPTLHLATTVDPHTLGPQEGGGDAAILVPNHFGEPMVARGTNTPPPCVSKDVCPELTKIQEVRTACVLIANAEESASTLAPC